MKKRDFSMRFIFILFCCFFLKKIELVHTDLKLENILFTIKPQLSHNQPSHDQPSHNQPSHDQPSHNQPYQPTQESNNHDHPSIQQIYTRSQLTNQFLKNDLFFHSFIFSSSRERENFDLNKFQDWIQRQVNKFDKKSTTTKSKNSSRRRRNENHQEEKKKNKFQYLFPSHCSIKSFSFFLREREMIL